MQISHTARASRALIANLNAQETKAMNFRKGNSDAFKDLNGDASLDMKIDIAQDHMVKVLDSKNLSFLLGSGCSSFQRKKDKVELGIPTMKPLAKEFQSWLEVTENNERSSEWVKKINENLGIDIKSDSFKNNLEELLSALATASTFCKMSAMSGIDDVNEAVDQVVSLVKGFILKKCTNGIFSQGDMTILDIYSNFYRSLANRSRRLTPPWVFTSNYDLFNEISMDRLNIPYSNGFSGTVERRFNPAMYRLTLAEQLDITSRRWGTVDNFVHFCKLHGSINWIEDDGHLYKIRECHEKVDQLRDRMMIYPVSSKQSASLGSPYSDMFRELYRQVVQNQSVLIVIGYGFGDEHINNIIFQGLTLPDFKLIVFANPETNKVTSSLKELKDPRIWFIWENTEKRTKGERTDEGADSKTMDCQRNPIHYFDQVVEHLLPINEDHTKMEEIMAKSMIELLSKRKDPGNAEG